MTLGINLKRKIVEKIAEQGDPKRIIEQLVLEKYGKEES